MTSVATNPPAPAPAVSADPASPRFGNARALACRECGTSVDLGGQHACPECFGPLEVRYDLPSITRQQIEAGPQNIWRYAGLLPVPPDVAARPNTEPGRSRLVLAEGLAAALGMRRLWVKDERSNPTHSFKDRVVAVALAAAVEMGYRVLACPSTGNLANAVAAAAARAGIESIVLVPANLEPAKILASAVYGGLIVKVEGGYDDVNRLACELAEEREDWAIGNPADGPYVLDEVRRTGVTVADAPDPEIVDAIRLLAATEGIFGETAVGVTIAVLRRLLAAGQIDPDEETVVINSGDGLKTLDAVAGAASVPEPIRPSLAEFTRLYEARR